MISQSANKAIGRAVAATEKARARLGLRDEPRDVGDVHREEALVLSNIAIAEALTAIALLYNCEHS